MDKIIISQLKAEAIIGVYEVERQKPQSLLIDLELEVDTSLAASNDDLSKTIDYAQVCQTLQKYITSTQFQLIETLAEQAAQQLLNLFNISGCQITIHKQPFDMPFIKNVAVQIKRSK